DEALANAFTQRPDYRQHLALMRLNLGILLAETGHPIEAESSFQAALTALEKLVAEHPRVPEYQGALGRALDSLAMLHYQRGQRAEVREHLEEAIRHNRLALQGSARNLDYLEFLFRDYAYLAQVLADRGDHVGSAKAVEEMIRLNPKDADAHRRAARFLA